MHEDTATKKAQLAELREERDGVKAQIQKAKAELRQLDKELKDATQETARDAIQARQAKLEAEVIAMETKLAERKEVYCDENCKMKE